MEKTENGCLAKINNAVRLCGAKSRRNAGAPCKQFAMKGRQRCRMHGSSKGPVTEEGKLRSAQANLKHGLYTKEAIIERKRTRMMLNWMHDLDKLNE